MALRHHERGCRAVLTKLTGLEMFAWAFVVLGLLVCAIGFGSI